MWLKIDDGYSDHPKVERAASRGGHGAIVLHIRLMCYAAKHLTDGEIPATLARRMASDCGKKSLPALLDSGLLVEDGDSLRLPDFLDYNPSRASVEAKRAKDRDRLAAGSRANRARIASESKRPVPSRPISTSGRDKGSARARAPEPSPHPPAEPLPAETRTLVDPATDTVALVLERLDQARGAPASRQPTPAELDRLGHLVRGQTPARVIAAAAAYVEDDHPSTASLTVAEFLRVYDRMAGIAARPRASPRADPELADTLRLGARPDEAPPPPPKPDPLARCACGHTDSVHSWTGRHCRRDGCGCEEFTPATEETTESAAAR